MLHSGSTLGVFSLCTWSNCIADSPILHILPKINPFDVCLLYFTCKIVGFFNFPFLQNNQVVAVQQHYVKPQPSETTETVLTEECKTETGLNEEAVKHSQPLEHILDEVSSIYNKSLHPPPTNTWTSWFTYILSNSSIYLFDYCRIPTYWCLFHSLIAFYVNIYNPVTDARISTRPFEGIFHICLPSLFRTKHCYVLLLLLSKHHQLLVNKQL